MKRSNGIGTTGQLHFIFGVVVIFMRSGGDNPHGFGMDVQFFTNESRQACSNSLTHFIGWAIKNNVVSRRQLKKRIRDEAVVCKIYR